MTNSSTPFDRKISLSKATSLKPENIWQWITHRERLQTIATAAGVFVLFVAFLTAVQFSTPNLAGNDGYYHIKLAYLMRTEGLKPVFDYLPFTILNAENFVDHHFLFHVLMIPFTFGDLRIGAKLASVIFPALAFLAIWWTLHKQKVPYAALWSLGLLAVSEAFIYRMSMPRAQSVSLAFLALGLHWLLTGKYGRLLPLAFLYVWLYNAFPLLLVVAGLYTLAEWLINRRIVWQPLAFTAAGIVLGLIINPYFPDNILFIYNHLAPKLFNPTEAIRVGNEWYPYDTGQLIENSGLALVAVIGGVLALGFHNRRMNVATATSLLVMLLSGFLLFQSRRFIEYFPAFALIFAAIASAPLIQAWKDNIRRMETSIPAARKPIAAYQWLVVGVITALLMVGVWKNLDASRESISNSKPYQRYAEATAWLKANTPEGERVFQTDWDDFPWLFFYNTHNTYMVGLDPTYMEIYDAELYDLWVDITKGRVEQPSQVIQDTFGAKYVFTDLKHGNFLDQAEADPNLIEVYRDDYAAIFQVVQTSE